VNKEIRGNEEDRRREISRQERKENKKRKRKIMEEREKRKDNRKATHPVRSTRRWHCPLWPPTA
jgi:hypothetical protein